MKKTFEKIATDDPVEPSTTREFPVWIVIRHTRCGDEFVKHYVVQKPERLEEMRGLAMHCAEDIAHEAAMLYGHGSTSVFGGKLILNTEPEEESE